MHFLSSGGYKNTFTPAAPVVASLQRFEFTKRQDESILKKALCEQARDVTRSWPADERRTEGKCATQKDKW